MKTAMIVTCIIFINAMNVNGQSKTIRVESDRVLNHDFSKYKTFAFTSMIYSNDELGLYFIDDLVLKHRIREAVKGELAGLGYEFDRQNADLIVTFRVFEHPTTITGFEGYGVTYWGDKKYREISDKTTYDVKPGTLLISLADKKTSQVVWQGFASGLIDNNRFIKDEGTIREAVNLILEEYGQRAREYTRK